MLFRNHMRNTNELDINCLYIQFCYVIMVKIIRDAYKMEDLFHISHWDIQP